MTFINDLIAENQALNHVTSNWGASVERIENGQASLPQETDTMSATPARKTRQQSAFEKLMLKGSPPDIGAKLKTVRIDGHDELEHFRNTHSFITDVTDYGDGTYEVEFFG